MNQKITLIANEKCWIEQNALEQLESLVQLDNVMRIIGLPDLHAGHTPIGIALETKNRLYPHLIGNDIGCGMGFFQTNIAIKKWKQDRMVKKLSALKSMSSLNAVNPFIEESPIYDIGTIGKGNHFAEFQGIEKIYDQKIWQNLKLDKNIVFLLVHSGSRSYGQQIFEQYSNIDGYDAKSEKAVDYMSLHNNALLWAERNRYVVATSLLEYIGHRSEPKIVLDCHHNFIEKQDTRYIHRKGALSTKQGAVIIPGSRGSLTYLVMPAENTEQSANSLSHGAGRKWARSLCKGRLESKYTRKAIRESAIGSTTVCHNDILVYEEAPEAYKNIDNIIEALVDHQLCHVIATFKPLVTYKG